MNGKPRMMGSFVAYPRCRDTRGWLWWLVAVALITVGGCGSFGSGGGEPCASPVGDAERAVLQAAIDRVSEDRLRADVAFLARAPRNRENAEHLEASRDYIKGSIESAGIEARSVSVTTTNEHLDGSSETAEVVIDIFCEIPGIEPDSPLIVLGAHYDSGEESPGADDNASGVSALLETARVLSSVRFSRTILIVFFDREETGLVGSWIFVRELERAGVAVEVMLNVDMVGYADSAPSTQTIPDFPLFSFLFAPLIRELAANQNRGDFLVLGADADSSFFSCRFDTRANELVPELGVFNLTVPWFVAADAPEVRALLRGDHESFSQVGIPAIAIGDTAEYRNPHYEEDTDVPETLDYGFLTACTRAIVAFAGSMAEPR